MAEESGQQVMPSEVSGGGAAAPPHQANNINSNYIPASLDINVPQHHQQRINQAPPPPPTKNDQDDDETSPKNKWINIGIVAAILVVLVMGAVVGGVCGSGNCGSSSSSSSSSSIGDGDKDTSSDSSSTSTLERVRQQGRLKCGVIKSVLQDSISEGFSADLCRAIAAAALGAPSSSSANNDDKVEFVEVVRANRFTMLQNGNVDVLAAEATHTMARDLQEPTTGVGFSFSVPYLYNGLGFAGDPDFVQCADDLNAQGNNNCTGIRICVLAETTHVDILESIYPDANLIRAPSVAASFNNFRQGLCHVVAGEEFAIAPAILQSLDIVQPYELGRSRFSKEPLALVTRDGDPRWSDFVNWVFQGLLYAEEINIKQGAAQLFSTTNLFGAEFSTMFIDSVSTVGNYGEIYARHLESMIPQANGANAINKGTSGLVYSMPFGTAAETMGQAVAGGTLQKIRARGELWCGIAKRGIFAVENTITGELTGQDVDFCRALSAAIFDGDADRVRYTDVLAVERFKALASGDVDVLSRITTVTFSRDVNEPTTMDGYSFSQPNFYDGMTFGGRPPFVSCADRLDTSSAECQGLKICVNEATTFVARLEELFPMDAIVRRKGGGKDTVQGLEEGVCNVLAGGKIDVTTTNVVAVGGYTGPYEIGTRTLTKDPLALVTRHDDQEWTSFVYWVVSAMFFAEEEGITRLRSFRMPIVNLFGDEYTKMFRNAVGAVGNFGEIYNRNVEQEVPRASLNKLNTNPLGPQHYALPGI